MIDPHIVFGPSARRRAALSTVMWLFGLATTVLLIATWGRTVSSDQATIEEGARAIVGAEVIANRVEDWVANSLANSVGRQHSDVAQALAGISQTPQARSAVTAIVEQAVEVVFADPGDPVEIEVGTALSPLSPVIGERLRSSGIDVPQEQVDATVTGVPDLVLSSGSGTTFSGAATRARAFLTQAALVAGLLMTITGLAAVFLSDDRIRMIRSLMIKVAVSALTFAVILRVSAWALDPDGGRSPVAAGGAVLLRSQGWLLPMFAVANLAAALAVTWVVARRRQPPTPETTEARPRVPAGTH